MLNLIKILSTILITVALSLEIWVQIANFNHQVIPATLKPIIWFERFALVSHFLKGFYLLIGRKIIL
jgi:hypothetical protein